MRCLPSNKIPKCLWSENVVKLPYKIVQLFENYLIKLGKYDEALNMHPNDVIGGESEDETIDHFTHRFATSAVRVEYLLLDPKQKFGHISNNLLTVLSTGRIAILDIPCGTGAGIISLLVTIAELRANRTIIQLPLYIHITGGDFSKKALMIYDELLKQIEPYLNLQNIHLEWNTYQWDAMHPGKTSEIMTEWFESITEVEEYVVLIAAFSGVAAKNFDQYNRSFQHITERLYNKPSIILWIEPKWNKSTKLFEKIKEMFKDIFWFKDDEKSEVISSTFKWFHPIQKKIIERGTVAVKEYSFTTKKMGEKK